MKNAKIAVLVASTLATCFIPRMELGADGVAACSTMVVPIMNDMTLEENEAEVVEEGISEMTEFEVPEEYALYGGFLDKDLLNYIECTCKQRGVSYPLVLALIERETGYKNVNNDVGCYGYMQVEKKSHEDRMARLGCLDLNNGYDNVTVGIDYIEELFEKYGDTHKVLMAYNMGDARAAQLWEQGIVTSKYSEYIVQRENEISLELYGY